MYLETAAFFILGLLFGSFANVLIHRFSLEESVVWGRSRCPHCKKTIAWWQNVPLVSYAILRARCHYCREKISLRYPAVEALTGILFALIFAHYGWNWLTLEYLIFAFVLVVVSVIDLDQMLLPDVYTLSGIAIGLLGAALNPERSFPDALAGVMIGGGLLWFVAALYFWIRKEEGMGGGDIKLLAWIGAVLGWQAIPVVVLLASLLGSFYGLSQAMIRKEGMRTAIPFGPYLSLGAMVYLLWGEALGTWYMRLLMPGF